MGFSLDLGASERTNGVITTKLRRKAAGAFFVGSKIDCGCKAEQARGILAIAHYLSTRHLSSADGGSSTTVIFILNE